MDYVDLGIMEYDKALSLQEWLLQRRVQKVCPDTLLLVEHPPVLTLGIRGQSQNIYASPDLLQEMGIQVYEIYRGGDVTYHGPGQIVGYPILDLRSLGLGVKDFVHAVEESIIAHLRQDFGILAHRKDKTHTGVWVEDRKIAAIGFAVKQGVTMHGFAYNVNTDLGHFALINPCGLGMEVISVAKITGQKQDLFKVKNALATKLCQQIGCPMQTVSAQSLLQEFV